MLYTHVYLEVITRRRHLTQSDIGQRASDIVICNKKVIKSAFRWYRLTRRYFLWAEAIGPISLWVSRYDLPAQRRCVITSNYITSVPCILLLVLFLFLLLFRIYVCIRTCCLCMRAHAYMCERVHACVCMCVSV